MRPLRDDVLQQALALPAEDRAFVAAALEQSLAHPEAEFPLDAIAAESHDAILGIDFLRELERRSAAFRNGSASARLAADVMADLRRRQTGEASV
jgi:hypothetical protein